MIDDFHDLGLVLDSPRGLRPHGVPGPIKRPPDGYRLSREAPDAGTTPLLELLR